MNEFAAGFPPDGPNGWIGRPGLDELCLKVRSECEFASMVNFFAKFLSAGCTHITEQTYVEIEPAIVDLFKFKFCKKLRCNHVIHEEGIICTLMLD